MLGNIYQVFHGMNGNEERSGVLRYAALGENWKPLSKSIKYTCKEGGIYEDGPVFWVLRLSLVYDFSTHKFINVDTNTSIMIQPSEIFRYISNKQ